MSANSIRRPDRCPAWQSLALIAVFFVTAAVSAAADQAAVAKTDSAESTVKPAAEAAACDCSCGQGGQTDRLAAAVNQLGAGGQLIFMPPPVVFLPPPSIFPPPPVGVTLPCGASGQNCCPGGGCNLGLLCFPTGRCMPPVACGMGGQPCCPGVQRCSAGLECSSGSICQQTCGAAGQTCCAQGTKCEAGLACNSNNVCRRPCGGSGEACCTGQSCDPYLACNAQNICRRCGEVGDICCPGSSCNSGKACNMTTRRCEACGNPGQPCCPTGCVRGTECLVNPAPGTCQICGGIGQMCCPNSRCDFQATCGTDFTCR